MFTRLVAIAAFAACAHAQTAGKISLQGSNLVLKPGAADGTVTFEEASAPGGKTSVFTILEDMKSFKTNVDQQFEATTAQVERALQDAAEELKDGLDTIKPALDEAAAKTDQAINQLTADVAATEKKLYAAVDETKASIDTVVQPKIDEVKNSLVALETKIKKDIDDDIKIKLLAVQNAVVGTNSALPAADCAAILKARPASVDGAYYVDSKYQSSPLKVWCAKVGSSFDSMGGDCSSKANACASCDANFFGYGESNRWVVTSGKNANDPGNSKSTKCEDNLMLKLVTTDGNKATWDSSFWSSSSLMNKQNAADSKWKGAREDIKAQGYLTPIGKTIEIVALKEKEQIGRAFYNIKSQYQGKSLKWLLQDSGAQNMVFATRDNGKSAKGRPIYSKFMKQRGGNHGQRPYDMFLDTTGDLVARQRNFGGAQNAWSRLSSTDRSGYKGCHVYTGLGGDHYCNGWRIQYEASPIVGYCGTYNRYGSNHENRKGGPEPNTHCGGDKRQSNIDFAILKNPK